MLSEDFVPATKHDDVSWHYQSAHGLFLIFGRWNNAAAHIALYLRWIIEGGLMGPSLVGFPEGKDMVERARAGEITYTSLLRWNDGKLVSHMLTSEADEFTKSFYDAYLEKLESLFPGFPLRKPETAYRYHEIKKMIDIEYENWKCRSGRPTS